MAYTLPSHLMDNCEGVIYCYAQWANSVTNGFFWWAILLGFVLVLLFATLRFGIVRAFGFSSFIGALASVWLVILNLIPWVTASPFIIIGIIGVISLLMSGKQ